MVYCKKTMSANMIHTGGYFSYLFQSHWAAAKQYDLELRLQYAPRWGSLNELTQSIEGFNPSSI